MYNLKQYIYIYIIAIFFAFVFVSLFTFVLQRQIMWFFCQQVEWWPATWWLEGIWINFLKFHNQISPIILLRFSCRSSNITWGCGGPWFGYENFSSQKPSKEQTGAKGQSRLLGEIFHILPICILSLFFWENHLQQLSEMGGCHATSNHQCPYQIPCGTQKVTEQNLWNVARNHFSAWFLTQLYTHVSIV